jgi:polyhydroxyalkanoate synthase
LCSTNVKAPVRHISTAVTETSICERSKGDDAGAFAIHARGPHPPWKSTYRGTQVLGGPKWFVLAASGHIVGVVNPPDGGKYSHWINTDLPADAEEWFKGATEIAGSW